MIDHGNVSTISHLGKFLRVCTSRVNSSILVAHSRHYGRVLITMSKVYTDYMPQSVRNRKDFDVRAGDTVRVHVKIQEKGKTRIQTFEGLVLARKHGSENGGTITVRKVSNGVGVERIFPLYSPNIDSIEVVRRAKVRRSKLYFLRDVVSRKMRYKLRRITEMMSSSADLPEWDTSDEVIPEDADFEEEVNEEEKEDGEENTGGEAPSEEASDTDEESESESQEEEKKEE